MNFTLSTSYHLPVGATVTVFPRSEFPAATAPRGTPPGSGDVFTGTMGSETLLVTGLSPATRYVAHAQVDGTHRYVQFTTDAEGAGAILAVDEFWNAGHADMTMAWKAAIAAAQAGDTILAPVGGGEVSAVLNITTDGITIRGNRGCLGRPDVTVADGATFMFRPILCDDVHFEHLVIDGNKAGGTTGFGVNFRGCTNSTAHRVTTINTQNAGIVLDCDPPTLTPCSDCEIAHCTVIGAGTDGISLSGENSGDTMEEGRGPATGAQGCRIHHNLVVDPTDAGINVSQSRSCTIEGNTVRATIASGVGSGNAGIRFSNGSQHCTCTANTVVGMPRGYTITGGVDENDPDGEAMFITITGNTARETRQEGMLIGGDYHTITANTIVNPNQGQSANHGIRLVDANHCTIGHNVIVDEGSNKIQSAIVATDSDYITVAGNVIKNTNNLPLQISGTNSKVGPNDWETAYSGAATTITAAATLAIRDHSDTYTISSGNSSSIISSAARHGRVITLIFSGSATIQHANNIKLAGAANFSATADDTLTLRCDGTNWHEVARAVI